ncbi:hypothetical protein [Roseivivax sp. CAU 1753]
MRPKAFASLKLLKRIKEAERDKIAHVIRGYRNAQDEASELANRLLDDILSRAAPDDLGASLYRATWLTNVSHELEHAGADIAQLEQKIDAQVLGLEKVSQDIMRIEKIVDAAQDKAQAEETRRGDEQLLESILLSPAQSKPFS